VTQLCVYSDRLRLSMEFSGTIRHLLAEMDLRKTRCVCVCARVRACEYGSCS
jgi:hypothetical protein